MEAHSGTYKEAWEEPLGSGSVNYGQATDSSVAKPLLKTQIDPKNLYPSLAIYFVGAVGLFSTANQYNWHAHVVGGVVLIAAFIRVALITGL